MHRYSTAVGGSGVGSAGSSGREGLRASADPSAYAAAGFSATRRNAQPSFYKLKCDKEPLSPRLGPPDYYPPHPNCPEELLTRETCQHGYREGIEGIEEGRETSYTLVGSSNTLWTKDNISRLKESLRKRLRAVTSALIRKRKAGQVYDVPLVGQLLAKPGYFPERHTCSEDAKRKWLEDLSQRKRLSLLADHVPHGLNKRTLFEALVKHKVPFLRATWFIKVLYLNQVRPASTENSIAGDRSQVKRLDQWTKDLLDYAQSALDEISQNGTITVDPDPQSKWQYIVRLVKWQCAEGLIQQSQVVEWGLKQIQEKGSLEKLERVLPFLLESMDLLALSQVHVRALVYISLDWLRQLGTNSSPPNHAEQPRQYQVFTTLVELLRYLLVAVPDTFVAFDCFPLPASVLTLQGSGTAKETEGKSDAQKSSCGHGTPYREVFITEVVDSIQKRAFSLTKAVNPGILRANEGKVIKLLDKSLTMGDVAAAYSAVFDNDFSGYEQLPAEWRDSASGSFLSGVVSNVSTSDLFAVRFLCEWAVCDFRDTRFSTKRPQKKPEGVKDMTRVYMAVSVLQLRKSELDSAAGPRSKKLKTKNRKLKASASSPGPMHDILVAWIDQHELSKGEGAVKTHLLLSELVRRGIFHPEAYVRQLIIEGTLEKNQSQADVVRATRHQRILRFLPGPSVELEDYKDDVPENVRIYRNERRLALRNYCLQGRAEGTKEKKVTRGNVKKPKPAFSTLTEVKHSASVFLQLPDVQGELKSSILGLKRQADMTPSCEECNRIKRLRVGETKGWNVLISEPEDTWWVKKVPKMSDHVKPDTAVKPPKQNVRGRPKTVRKTQSLAHLRIDGSQVASSSYTYDTKTQCPYHKPHNKTLPNDSKTASRTELSSIGSAIKQLRFLDKHAFSMWISKTIRDLCAAGSQGEKWHLTEERFSAVVYMLDVALDFHSLLRLILWLLAGRGLSKDVSDAAIMSCLRRYEGVMGSMNLLTEALSCVTQCAAVAVSTGRSSASQFLCFARDMLRKYSTLPSMQSWERSWRMGCDHKLAAEYEAVKTGDGDGIGVFGSVERDDPIPQRLNSRLAKLMRDIVQQKGMGDIVQMVNREKDMFSRDVAADKSSECVHRVVASLLDTIKQHQNGSSLQADTALINAAVSAIVSNASSAAGNACEGFLNNLQGADNLSLTCARRILLAHVHCLRLLKEALDDRQSRVLEASLATEASNLVGGLFVQSTTGRAPRSQFHLSPETPELGSLPEYGTGPNAATTARAAAATALVVLAVVQGVVGLERVISVLKIREGLEALHLPKFLFTATNGIYRGPSVKSDSLVEGHIYWFRALVGDCTTASSGLVADILGEANVVALERTQRLLPLNSVFTMAYAMFCGLLRRQVLSHMHIVSKDDGAVQSLTAAVKDIVAHEPFRELCLQDTKALYHLFSSEVLSSDYAAILDAHQGIDARSKVQAMLPFSARLFLHALLDKKLPQVMQWQDDEAWMDSRFAFDHGQQVQQMVRILDDIQPATFHWQWLELRLLLNEQVFVEKLEGQQGTTVVKALQDVWISDSMTLSECEKTFIDIVLTRLLCRPDAAALYSEVLFSLGTCKPKLSEGRPLEDYLIIVVKWVLKGGDVLHGRKSLRQHLESYAVGKSFSCVASSSLKTWGWQRPPPKAECAALLEEGELPVPTAATAAATAAAAATPAAALPAVPTADEAAAFSQQFATEKALAELVLPCLARGPNESCTGFAADLVSQMTELEQQVALFTKGRAAAQGSGPAAAEAPLPKAQGTRRAARAGAEGGANPAVRRRPAQAEQVPVSVAALQSSLWLRLQFLLPLLRIIYCDHRDHHTGRTMRLTLAPVLMRLLGTRIVQESAESFAIHNRNVSSSSGGGSESWNAELSAMAAAASAGEELFDRLLSVLHALLSSTWAAWLKPRATGKGPAKPPREVPPFDRETAERMQTELDHMQLPRSIRLRLQAVMPLFPPPASCVISAAPPQPSLASSMLLQSSLNSSSSSSSSGGFTGVISGAAATMSTTQTASTATATATTSTSSTTTSSVMASLSSSSSAGFKQPPPVPALLSSSGSRPGLSSSDAEVTSIVTDPWTLLEDGTGVPCSNTAAAADPSTASSAAAAAMKAAPWLRGAIRVRRADLTYVGCVDSDT